MIARTSGAQVVTEGAISGGTFVPTTVTLNAEPSQPKAVVYSWTQDANDAYGVVLSDPSAAKPTFTAPNVGAAGATLHFTVTVTGCDPLQTQTATTTVTVTDVNSPPLVAASAPSTVNEGDLFLLDGSGSSDPDGDPLTYRWDRVVGGSVEQVGATAVVELQAPAVPYPAGASFTYRLTVSDGTLSSSADVVVTVKWVNDPPIANAECTSPVNEGASILLDGADPSKPSTDPDDGIASYAWRQSSGGPDANLAAEALSYPALAFDAPQLTLGHGDTMTFELKVTDNGGLFSTDSCQVVVKDVTAPVLSPPNITREATSASGAIVVFSVTGNDAFDGEVPAACDPQSGATFPVGDTVVTCTASDQAGNRAGASFTVSIVDTTPPDVIVPASLTEEATSAAGAVVTFSASASDLVDGAVTPVCTPASGSTFPLGTTTVSCTATDAHGNGSDPKTFTVTVQDTTPPAITVPGDITTLATSAAGAPVSFAASATDLVDGAVTASCTPQSGSSFAPGTTTVSCTASDSRGNAATPKTFTVTVQFAFLGFFQPVDNLPLVNTVKNGATVPVKWKLQGQGGVEITDVAAVDLKNTRAQGIACGALTSVESQIELTTTGGTALRYDLGAAQYVLNWQTPKQPGSCWRLDLVFADGSTQSANFKLK
ncbi:PxKF domain-containing protein [Anaeromyxobacter terrae]|uniref:PxKF domain-containing protein n=1 Tax=Anaeromyxobacter terrae TaxID=2925406 RepID=UPI001F58E9EB|nr:PxKF domain-containing protein [Anaeromyxobacter sp. SG22]